MKGRWRKDKRTSTEKINQGIAHGGKHASEEGGLSQREQSGSLAGFTFSGSLAKACAQRDACFANAHSSLVRSQFAMCDGQTHDDFMVRLRGLEVQACRHSDRIQPTAAFFA